MVREEATVHSIDILGRNLPFEPLPSLMVFVAVSLNALNAESHVISSSTFSISLPESIQTTPTIPPTIEARLGSRHILFKQSLDNTLDKIAAHSNITQRIV